MSTQSKLNALSLSLDSVDDLISDDDATAPAPEDFIVNVGDVDDEPSDVIEGGADGPAWVELQNRITELRMKYRRSEVDTGSPEYQIATITERITHLTAHLIKNPKDFSTRRGLVALVNQRRRLLNYLFKESVDRYKDLVASLGIRHRAPSRVQSKEEMYGRFPVQKPNKYPNQIKARQRAAEAKKTALGQA